MKMRNKGDKIMKKFRLTRFGIGLIAVAAVVIPIALTVSCDENTHRNTYKSSDSSKEVYNYTEADGYDDNFKGTIGYQRVIISLLKKQAEQLKEIKKLLEDKLK